MRRNTAEDSANSSTPLGATRTRPPQSARSIGSGSSTSSTSIYGYVVSFREDYGFIQPLNTFDHVYFDRKDGPQELRMGDEISFTMKSSKRGAFAVSIQSLDRSKFVTVSQVNGTVLRDYDSHRQTPGMIDISDALKTLAVPNPPSNIPYRIISASNFGPKKGHKIVKGDEVTFDLTYVPDTTYFTATNIHVAISNKEKKRQQIVQEMISNGAVLEQGIIETIIADYGFLAPVNSTDQIYFKLDDIMHDNIAPADIKKGLEVEFIMITESIKGKLSSRAVHLQPLPKGTVSFEDTLAVQVQALVSKEPRMFPSEVPGTCILLSPVVIPGKEPITQVELWGRCLPDHIFCRHGDTLLMDVVYYKREKLIFARSVSILAYEPLNREIGMIVRMRDAEPFGFIRSEMRETDIYFRTKDVTISKEGEGYIPAEISDVLVNKLVSFNLIIDESSGASSKMKAVRVHILHAEAASAEIASRKILLSRQVEGVILTEAHKEHPGRIQISAGSGHQIEMNDAGLLATINKEQIANLQAFADSSILTDMTVENLMTSQRKVMYELIDKLFTGIGYELLEITGSQANMGGSLRSLRIHKLSTEEYAAWKAANQKEPRGNSNSLDEAADKSMVHYAISDSNDKNGALISNYHVLFDMYYDRKTGKRIAKNVTVKEEIAVDALDAQTGVIQVVKSKSKARYGVIRVHPTNEKLFWHSSCVLPTAPPSKSKKEVDNASSLQLLNEGTEVTFYIKVRGGMRCAVDIQLVLSDGALSRENSPPGRVQVLMVESNKGVILSTAECPMLDGVYSDVTATVNTLTKNAESEASSWSHVDSVGEEKAVVGMEAPDVKEGETSTPQQQQQQQQQQQAIQYFTPCERLPVPVQDAQGNSASLKFGSVVWCSVVMKPAASITPIRLVFLNNIENQDIVKVYRGVVNRVKLKTASENSNLFEIRKDGVFIDGNVTDDTAAPLFYYAEESLNVGKTQRPFFVGAVVKFLGFPSTSLAFNLLSNRFTAPITQEKDEGIVFRRSVNADLKQTVVNKGVTGIVMAGGPPDDNATGFAAGWRGEATPSTDDLPWKHLLTHLI